MDDGDEGRHRSSRRHQGTEAALGIDAHAVAQQLKQRFVFLGSHEEVHVGELVTERIALGAHHAAHEGHDPIRVASLERFQRGDHAHHPVLGALSDDTAIEDDDVGILGTLGALQPQLRQGALQPLRVGDVHLATDGPDEVAAGRRGQFCGGHDTYGGGSGIRTHEGAQHPQPA